MTKKTNPQDATRRNVQAANKRLVDHGKRLKKIEGALHDAWTVTARVRALELRLLKLEPTR